MRRPAMRLKSADFPTFGLPTIAINPAIPRQWSSARPLCNWPKLRNDKDQPENSPRCAIVPRMEGSKKVEEGPVSITAIEVREIGADANRFELKSVVVEETILEFRERPAQKVSAIIAAFGDQLGGKRALTSTWGELARQCSAERAQSARDRPANETRAPLTLAEKQAQRDALWPNVRELAAAPDPA